MTILKLVKDWYNEHKSLIIGLLVMVIMLKGCQSCNMERRYEYQETQYEYVIDSMQTVIDGCSVDSKSLCDTIYALRRENTVLKDVIKDIRKDKEHYRKANNELMVVTENLSTKRDTMNIK